MLKRHGFGASDAIGAIVALGVTGVVGYSMVSGRCLLGSCDAGTATSPATVPVATVISADNSSTCTACGGGSLASGLILASGPGTDGCPLGCDGATAIADEAENKNPLD